MTMGEAGTRSGSDRVSVLCVGPACIDVSTFESGGAVVSHPGGNALITSSVIARLAVPAAILACVGRDADGDRIARWLRAAGVRTDGLEAVDGCVTRVNHIDVHLDGTWRRTSKSEPPCPYLVTHAFLDTIDSLVHCHVGAANALMRDVPRALEVIVRRCRALGATISFGLAGDVSNTAAISTVFGSADLLFCNQAELVAWTGCSASEPVHDVIGRAGFDRVGVTLGARGAIAKWGSRVFACDGCPPAAEETSITSDRMSRSTSRVVNTVGAGDVFAATFIAAVVGGVAAERSLAAATSAASRSVLAPVWDDWMSSGTSVGSLI
jgi:sugar/nucleoside kinase (ribokinase family)